MDSKQSRSNKRKGGAWETEIVGDARGRRGYDAERQPKNGSRDSGDVVIRFPGLHLVVEAKNEKSISLPGYLAELAVEVANYRKARPSATAAGVVFVKRRQYGAAKGYAVMEVDAFYDLLELLTRGIVER
jgi:Holliday junction resolvase